MKRLRLSQFEKHYLNDKTKDVTFVVCGQRIPAHKIILSSRSDVFDAMLFGKCEEIEGKEIELNDTSIESFKLFLKFIYLDEFDSNDIKDHTMAIDIFKLSDQFKIKHLSDIIEEELIKMLNFDNFALIIGFAMYYNLNKLLDSFKDFVNKNEKQMIAIIEKALIREPIQAMEKLIDLLKLSQKQLISALINISDKVLDKDLVKFRVLVKFDLCSVHDLNALRSIRLFDEKELNKVIEDKYEDLEKKYQSVTAGYEKLRAECEEKSAKYVDLSNRYVDLNSQHIELMANYREVKDIFGPFVEGIGGRVNQFVYNKTNCYLGKMNKRFYFKY